MSSALSMFGVVGRRRSQNASSASASAGRAVDDGVARPGACVRQWSAKWRAVAIFARRNAESPLARRELPRGDDAARASCAPPQTMPASSRNGTAPARTARGSSRKSRRSARRRRAHRRRRAAARRSPRGRPIGGRPQAPLPLAHRRDRGGERRAAVARDLAADQVVRLDAGRAFVDRRDARIAHVLRGAGFLDEAHAAVDLDAERGDLLRDLGAPALDDRDHQLGERELAPARFGVGMPVRVVERGRSHVAQRPRGLGARAHRHQHPSHVGMADDARRRPPSPRRRSRPCTRSRA